MKKFISLVLVVISALCLFACNSNTAGSTVKGFCESMKSLDLEGMGKYIGVDMSDIDFSFLESEYTVNLIKKGAKELKYQIISEEKVGDNVIVKVKFDFIDMAKVYQEAMKEYLSEALSSIFSSSDADTKSLEEKFAKLCEEKFVQEKEFITANAEFECKQVDGKWLICGMNQNRVLDIMSGNLISYIRELANSLSGVFD